MNDQIQIDGALEVDQAKPIQKPMAKNTRLFDNDYDEDVVDWQGFEKPFDAEVVDPGEYSMESSAERQVSIGLQFISTDTATYLSRLAFESTHR